MKIKSDLIWSFSSSLVNIISVVILFKLISLSQGLTGVGMFSLSRQLILVCTTFGASAQLPLIDLLITSSKKNRYSRISSAVYGVIVATIVLSSIALLSFGYMKVEQEMYSMRSAAINFVIIVIITFSTLQPVFRSVFIYQKQVRKIFIYELVGAVALIILGSISVVSNTGQEMFLFSAISILAVPYTIFNLLSISAIQQDFMPKPFSSQCNLSQMKFIIAKIFDFILQSLKQSTLAIITPIAFLVFKSYISGRLGLVELGKFEIAISVSSIVFSFLISSSSLIVSRRLLELKGTTERGKFVNQFVFSFSILILILGCFLLMTSDLLVSLLYSSAIKVSGNIVSALIIANVVKGLCWLFVAPILSDFNLKPLIILELAWNGLFIALVLLLPLAQISIYLCALLYLALYVIVFPFYFFMFLRHENIRLTAVGRFFLILIVCFVLCSYILHCVFWHPPLWVRVIIFIIPSVGFIMFRRQMLFSGLTAL
jgi:O-antigen/teichoic acid export membrane protein